MMPIIAAWLVIVISLINGIPNEHAIPALLKAFSTALLFSTLNHGHGYKNLAKQSSRTSILFCMHENVYQS